MIRIQDKDFDVAAETMQLRNTRTDIGAMVTFTGLVRDFAQNARITAMTLEHYPGMTEQELERIVQTARQRWQLLDCLIIHRVGRLVAGEQIVLVITLSAHRQNAFRAAEFIMDYLKTSAPFWKKEETDTGAADWVEAKSSDRQARAAWRTGGSE